MKEYLTHQEAYEAMFAFLEDYYNRSKSNEIGGLLGSMSLIEGRPVDSALWDDWCDAIEKSFEDPNGAQLNLSNRE
ncbi:hypothetical protein RCH20_002450 [Psychrobacter sp. PL15]|jgi:hypothetical protein|uniref:hypothetical protein n=1 Tax=Psychrobacter sp. PL15 TaxID=3071719 RepID=UPI002E09C051|nr:hypothetical protein [Psychrobacter sp. PL15]